MTQEVAGSTPVGHPKFHFTSERGRYLAPRIVWRNVKEVTPPIGAKSHAMDRKPVTVRAWASWSGIVATVLSALVLAVVLTQVARLDRAGGLDPTMRDLDLAAIRTSTDLNDLAELVAAYRYALALGHPPSEVADVTRRRRCPSSAPRRSLRLGTHGGFRPASPMVQCNGGVGEGARRTPGRRG